MARLATLYGVVIALAGVFTLVLGCALHVTLFERGFASFPPLSANSAFGFILLGTSLAIRTKRAPSLLLSAAVLLLGAITLLEYSFDFDEGIDSLLMHSERMAPAQAVCLVLEGGAVFLLGTRALHRAAPYVALAAGAIGLVRAVAYLYGVDSAAGFAAATYAMSLPAALLAILFAQGLAVAAPNAGLVGLVAVDSPAGRAVQRMLLAVTSVPLVLGFIRLQGERLGLYDAPFGLVLFASANAVVLAALTWWVAAQLVRSELAQRDRERWLSTTLSSIGDAVIATDDSPEARVVRMNAVASSLTGWAAADAKGKPLADVFKIISEDTRAPVESPAPKVLREGHVVGLANHTLLVAKDGTERPIADSGAPIRDDDGNVYGVVLVFRDQSDERAHEREVLALEHQLQQSQKMEAIGKLAGGVAHDFNNLLSIVLSYADLILQDLPDANPLRGDVGEIKRAGERASALTRQLLAFSRKQLLKPQLLELNDLVEGSLKMLGRLLPESIALTFASRAAGPTTVNVDAVQLEQVLMNLVVNARDAIEKRGTITVATDHVDAGGKGLDLPPGRYVVTSVVDDGAGMDEATQARVFEPFFTTKDKDKGTGLGLAVAFGIARQSGGTITVESAPGKGSTFRVYLPVAASAGAQQQSTAPPSSTSTSTSPRSSSSAAATHPGVTILLVEDEAQVREVAARVLRNAGHNVLVAADGAAALALSAKHDGHIDLLLTDVVMPGMSGGELAQALKPLRPRTRTLFMSGFTDDAIVKHDVAEEGVAFLQKPIAPDALLAKVRDVLER